MRNSIRNRRCVYSELPGLGEEALSEIKSDAENRMQVFDVAPKHVRDRTNEQGIDYLTQWWNTQDDWDFDGQGNLYRKHRFERIF